MARIPQTRSSTRKIQLKPPDGPNGVAVRLAIASYCYKASGVEISSRRIRFTLVERRLVGQVCSGACLEQHLHARAAECRDSCTWLGGVAPTPRPWRDPGGVGGDDEDEWGKQETYRLQLSPLPQEASGVPLTTSILPSRPELRSLPHPVVMPHHA